MVGPHPRRAALALLAAQFLGQGSLVATVLFTPPQIAYAQCPGGVCRPRPIPAPAAPPFPREIPTRPQGGSSGLGNLSTQAQQEAGGPLAGLFQPGTGLFGQPVSFITGFFTSPALLAASILPAVVQALTRSLFTRGEKYEPDIIVISPSDPHGKQVIREEPSSFGRRGLPPSPYPPKDIPRSFFRVENQPPPQAQNVEENPPQFPIIVPTRIGSPPPILPPPR